MKKMHLKCCVPNCEKTQDQVLLHRLPCLYQDLYNVWLERIGRQDLADQDPGTVYSKFRICDDHFTDDLKIRSLNQQFIGLKGRCLPNLNVPGFVDEPTKENSFLPARQKEQPKKIGILKKPAVITQKLSEAAKDVINTINFDNDNDSNDDTNMQDVVCIDDFRESPAMKKRRVVGTAFVAKDAISSFVDAGSKQPIVMSNFTFNESTGKSERNQTLKENSSHKSTKTPASYKRVTMLPNVNPVASTTAENTSNAYLESILTGDVVENDVTPATNDIVKSTTDYPQVKRARKRKVSPPRVRYVSRDDPVGQSIEINNLRRDYLKLKMICLQKQHVLEVTKLKSQMEQARERYELEMERAKEAHEIALSSAREKHDCEMEYLREKLRMATKGS